MDLGFDPEKELIGDTVQYDPSVCGYEESMQTKVNRLKIPRRTVDWSALVEQLVNDTGCSYEEIASAIGMKRQKVRNIAHEHDNFDFGTQAVLLVGIFLLNTDRDIPLYGDHNPIKGLKQCGPAESKVR